MHVSYDSIDSSQNFAFGQRELARPGSHHCEGPGLHPETLAGMVDRARENGASNHSGENSFSLLAPRAYPP